MLRYLTSGESHGKSLISILDGLPANIELNIDEINEKYDDCIIRKKRLDFYIKNNFYNTNYLSVNGCSIGHILSNKQEFNVEKYKLFDKKISRWFLCKNDEIKKSYVINKGSDINGQ